ncbi:MULTISPECIES: helix-turn-helix transcriptional regulator [Curtobacterium]|jgi:transcriptional regulator with XRE-family HTH domain|uniref:helix-turn-helix domain-containing protein n=1 Tax=Curtobacterium TaxID=2034 RepID=UPI0011A28666|nr:helix-turn-helix transcriptional regulator [Curtobacterium pusillum]
MAGYDISRQGQDFGAHLRGWRLVLGLTAVQVCERADITPTTLRNLERGKTTVGFDVVLRVCRALGVIDQLTASVDPLASDLGRARASALGRVRAGRTPRVQGSSR